MMQPYLVNFFLGMVTPAGIASVLRWALAAACGALVAKGWLTTDQVAECVTVVVTGVVPLVWGILQKVRQQEITVAALLQNVGTLEEAKATAKALRAV